MPSDEDDDDHDVIATTTAGAATTSLPPAPDASESPNTSVPTDHPERPTKPNTGGDATQTIATVEPTSTAAESESGTTEEETTGSSWVPSFLPSFGASASTQAWIYGSISLIAVFCCGLGAWLWWARRQRLRNNPHDKYEFEPLNPDDNEGGLPTAGAGGGRNGEKGNSRRGGELYDAFAGGSEDEDDLDDLVSPLPRGRRSSASTDDSEDDEEVRSEKPRRGGGGEGAATSRLLTGNR